MVRIERELFEVNSPMAKSDIDRVTDAVRRVLLGGTSDGLDYGYSNLPLCMIDAVFSLRQPYAQVRRTIERFTHNWNARFAPPRANSDELTVSVFLRGAEEIPAPRLAAELFEDAHQAPGCRGTLKAAVVVQLAQRLKHAGIESRGDVLAGAKQESLADAISLTKGIGSVGLRYLRMLCGEEDEAKPDVWVLRFLEDDVLHRPVNEGEAVALLRAATGQLRAEIPTLTLRAVDHMIWESKSSFRKAGTSERPACS